MRWCLANGLRVVQPMTLMSTDSIGIRAYHRLTGPNTKLQFGTKAGCFKRIWYPNEIEKAEIASLASEYGGSGFSILSPQSEQTPSEIAPRGS